MVLLGEWQDHQDYYLAARKSYVSLQNLLLEGGVVPVHYVKRYKMKAVPRHVIQDVDKLETIQLGPVSIHVPQIDCINSELFNINDIKLYNDCKSKIVEMHKLLNISIPTIKEQSQSIIAAKKRKIRRISIDDKGSPAQPPAAATDSVVVSSTPPPRHTSSPSTSVDCTPTVPPALFFRQLGNQLFSLLKVSIIDKLEYRASGVNLQYFTKPVDERYPADRFIEVCDELLTFLIIDQEKDLSNFLMVQKKYMYRLGHEIYGNCVTKIAENGYCLYHVATILSNLDKKLTMSKILSKTYRWTL